MSLLLITWSFHMRDGSYYISSTFQEYQSLLIKIWFNAIITYRKFQQTYLSDIIHTNHVVITWQDITCPSSVIYHLESIKFLFTISIFIRSACILFIPYFTSVLESCPKASVNFRRIFTKKTVLIYRILLELPYLNIRVKQLYVWNCICLLNSWGSQVMKIFEYLHWS